VGDDGDAGSTQAMAANVVFGGAGNDDIGGGERDDILRYLSSSEIRLLANDVESGDPADQ
jgi:hypothetical protein